VPTFSSVISAYSVPVIADGSLQVLSHSTKRLLAFFWEGRFFFFSSSRLQRAIKPVESDSAPRRGGGSLLFYFLRARVGDFGI
jgi:hypothetical protein